MGKVVLILLNFIKELLDCCITEFLKGWEVWLTKSIFLVAPQERVHTHTQYNVSSFLHTSNCQLSVEKNGITCLVSYLSVSSAASELLVGLV